MNTDTPPKPDIPLADLERQLVNGIHPLVPDENKHVLTLITAGGSLDPRQRLDVYRNNITSTRVRALQSIYPVCESILGTDCFRGVAREFAWQEDDRCADLNRYGETFPAFLDARCRENKAFEDLPYLEELGLLEWYWHASYYAADDPVFDPQRFAEAAANPETLYFSLSHSLGLMQTEYPVREIHARHRHGDAVDSVPALTTTECLCIQRHNNSPAVSVLTEDSQALLQAIRRGYSLQQLGDELGESLATVLPEAIQTGRVFTRR